MNKRFLLCIAVALAIVGNANAGWLADFLCYGDNNPRACRKHLPDWVLNAAVSAGSEKDPRFQKLKQDFSKLKDANAKSRLLQSNRRWIEVAVKEAPANPRK